MSQEKMKMNFNDDDLKVALKQLGREKIKKRLGSLDNKSTGKTITLRSILSIAASLLFFCMISLWVVNQNYSNDKLETDYFHEIEYSNERGTSNTSRLVKIINHYNNKQYSKCIEFLKEENLTDSELLIKANAFYHLEYNIQSDKILNRLLQSSDLEIRQQAEWLLVILSLKSDQNNTQLLIDNILAQKNHAFYKDARQLNDKLDAFFRKFTF